MPYTFTTFNLWRGRLAREKRPQHKYLLSQISGNRLHVGVH